MKKSPFLKNSKKIKPARNGGLNLKDGDRVGIIGGGPAGALFAYFVLDMAARIELDLVVDIYEYRNFLGPGPGSCNKCGGIISETLVQMLATEGIILPDDIIQRGIESYTLHTDTGTVNIETPLHEKRIGAVHRGCGPKDLKELKWGSFDAYLQILAIEKGAKLHMEKVEQVIWNSGIPHIQTTENKQEPYDVVAVAVGVNTNSLGMFANDLKAYKAPGTAKTMIREFKLGEELIAKTLGNSMHIFLLDIPGLEFAAFIPKGDYVTFCMLGKGINNELLQRFLNSESVRSKLPEALFTIINSCQCNPKINVSPAMKPYANRIVFIGDSGVSRLYKDGIGAAYKTAKAAASTVVFKGVSAADFKKNYYPVCRTMRWDNQIGKTIFAISSLNQRIKFARHSILSMVTEEQRNLKSTKYMSTVMWDMFTGSATYREILLITLNPVFLLKYLYHLIISIFLVSKMKREGETI